MVMLPFGMNGELCDTNYENTPGRLFENLSGLIFVFCNAIIVMDRRGRRSLQGRIKHPYENHTLAVRFLALFLSFLQGFLYHLRLIDAEGLLALSVKVDAVL